jgi:hypothetical protein
MRTIHDQIQDYIKGELSEEDVRHLWEHFLNQPLWYDYFITELTSHKIFQATDGGDEHINSHLWDLVEYKPV